MLISILCVPAYLFHLGADPSAFVRRSVLTIIGRTNITLPHILERTRDVKDTVRRHAYLVLSKLNIRSLTIRQRERLLREGLKDRSGITVHFNVLFISILIALIQIVMSICINCF